MIKILMLASMLFVASIHSASAGEVSANLLNQGDNIKKVLVFKGIFSEGGSLNEEESEIKVKLEKESESIENNLSKVRLSRRRASSRDLSV